VIELLFNDIYVADTESNRMLGMPVMTILLVMSGMPGMRNMPV